MSAQDLKVIDHSVQLTHEWINDMAGRLGWVSKRSALRLMRVTLHAVRDRLQVAEVAHLSAQLPLMIRGIYFEGWSPEGKPNKDRHAYEFVGAISGHMDDTEEFRGREDITSVFDLLNARISRGEIEDVRANLPGEIRALWPAP
ncbi:MAG: DUF2267 domain-containing protein [Silicimonas sp.]|nr:DUF2267 domain-containing protein [Silicimonas sp.]